MTTLAGTDKQIHLDHLRRLHGRKAQGKPRNMWCDPAISRRQLQSAAAFLGIAPSKLGVLLGNPHPSNGRMWLSKRMDKVPSSEYLTRLNQLTMTKAQRPHAIDTKAMTIKWGPNLYALTAHPIYANDQNGQRVILPSFWEEIWQKKSG